MGKFIKVNVVLISLISLIFVVGCGPTSDEDCTFLTEKANLHEEYIVSVSNVQFKDSIFILAHEGDTAKSELSGTRSRYVEVTVLIEHQNIVNADDHVLDDNDFKLKDHTGVKIKNVTFLQSLQASAKSEIEFSTRTPIYDYTWMGTGIEAGTSKEIMLYFEFSKEFEADKALMILEADFYVGGLFVDKNKGTDIVLINRTNDNL